MSAPSTARQPPIEDHRIGRDGFLRLAVERRGGRTVLTDRQFTLPLQALEPIPLDGDGSLLLTLLNPTGGLVGGDHLETEVLVGTGAHLCLTTVSATKVYRTAGPPAVQNTVLSLDAGAIVEYLPDHVIPYPGAALSQSLSISLASESVAIISESLAVGRLARGERWRFSSIESSIRVMAGRAPCFIDRMKLAPELLRSDGLGGTEGFGYIATFVVAARRAVEWDALSDTLHSTLLSLPTLSGVSRLTRDGLVVRLLAENADDLHRAIHRLWSVARGELLGLPPIDLRKF
jgi:urease accessory protein